MNLGDRLNNLLTIISTVALVFASVRANSLLCWSNQCGNGNDWCIETCPHGEESGQISCLAQYRRLINGMDIASYFGCHHATVPCSHECVPSEELSHSFICCCSGDLCNSIPALTPTGDTITPPTNPSDPPTVDPHDSTLTSTTLILPLPPPPPSPSPFLSV